MCDKSAGSVDNNEKMLGKVVYNLFEPKSIIQLSSANLLHGLDPPFSATEGKPYIIFKISNVLEEVRRPNPLNHSLDSTLFRYRRKSNYNQM